MLRMNLKKKVEGFDLEINLESEKNRIGILGPSGTGKSMMLKMIAGILQPDEGYLEIGGKVLYDSSRKIHLAPQKRKVGYLFQNYALFPNMTVEKNIEIGMEKGKRDRKRILEMMERFSISDLRNRYPRELSGGQQQRVALARIFASEPEVILLDEPFSALDGNLKEKMLQETLQMLKGYEGLVCMVSHSREEIYSFSQELVVLDQGRIVEKNSVKELFEKPSYVEAAKLVGVENISPIEWVGEGVVRAKEWGLTLALDTAEKLSFSHVGIRGRDLQIGKEKSIVEENQFKMFLEDVILSTEYWQYYIKKDQRALPICVKNLKLQTESEYGEQQKVWVTIPKEKILLLQKL